MSGHTPEPWRVDSQGVARVTSQDGRRLVASAGGHSSNVDFEAVDAENKANAFRIVACVNACRGVPTESLENATNEDGKLSPMSAIFATQRNHALRERDEARAMVAELKALLREREDGDALLEGMGLLDDEGEVEILSTTCGACYHIWPGDVKTCPGCGAILEDVKTDSDPEGFYGEGGRGVSG